MDRGIVQKRPVLPDTYGSRQLMEDELAHPYENFVNGYFILILWIEWCVSRADVSENALTFTFPSEKRV